MGGRTLNEPALALLGQITDQGLGGFVEKYFSFIVLGLVMTVGYVVWRVFGTSASKNDGPTLEESFQQAQKEIRESQLEIARQDEPVAHPQTAPSPPPAPATDAAQKKPVQPPMDEA